MSAANRYAKRANFASRIRTPLLREHYVYRAYDNEGGLLYVGCTFDVAKRIKEHRYGQWRYLMVRLHVAGPFNYETARQLEHDAIESERPQFNFTSDHRKVKKVRERMIQREVAANMAAGLDYIGALHRAIPAVDDLLPEFRNVRMTDFTVPTARRIEAEHAARLERAA